MMLAPIVPMTATHSYIRDGIPGIFQTIGVMRSLVNTYRTDPDIRAAASSVVFLTPEKQELSEVSAVFDFVRDSIRYLRDILNVETIAIPTKTLRARIGDCDDQSVLLASMLESIGYPTRFVVAGYSDPDALEHVYLQVCVDGQWIDADPTEHHALGYSPPEPVSLYVENV